jgi:hypothetical protein
MQRKFVIGFALSLGLVLGLVFAPMLTTQASAQTQPQQQTSLTSVFLDKLASALGIQRSALDSAITTAANGTVDQELAAGNLTDEQATRLRERIAAGEFLGTRVGGRHGGGRGDVAGVRQAMYDAAASTLNITVDEFKTQLRSGQTLAQIAQANNSTEQAVVDAALAAAKTKLDEAVAAGTLTREQADAAYTRLQQGGSDIFRSGGGRGRGAPRTPGTETPTATPAPAGIAS